MLICLKSRRHQSISNIYYVPRKKDYNIHIKNQSLLIKYWHANLIANVSITRNRMFLLSIQNDAMKYLKSCINNSFKFDT